MKLAQLLNPKQFLHVTTGACKSVRGFLIFKISRQRQTYVTRDSTFVILCMIAVISFAIVPVRKRSIRLSPLVTVRVAFHLIFLFVFLFCSPKSQADAGEDAARALARKVASTPSRDVRLFLVWENHVGLSEESSLRMHEAFVSELGGLLTISSNAPLLRVAIEETPSQIVLTARVPAGQEEQIHVFAFYKATLPVSSSAGAKIRMQKELVWEQVGQILDAVEFINEASQEKNLLILGKDSIAFYQGGEDQWKLLDRKALPASEKPTRNARGEIRFSKSSSTQIILPDKLCDLTLSDKIEMRCQDHVEKSRQVAILTAPCSDTTFLIRSDERDGSVLDKIFLRNPASSKMDAAIAELEFPGPVRSIFPGEDSQTAGAVVFNLSSGVYAVYRLSAVCGN